MILAWRENHQQDKAATNYVGSNNERKDIVPRYIQK